MVHLIHEAQRVVLVYGRLEQVSVPDEIYEIKIKIVSLRG